MSHYTRFTKEVRITNEFFPRNFCTEILFNAMLTDKLVVVNQKEFFVFYFYQIDVHYLLDSMLSITSFHFYISLTKTSKRLIWSVFGLTELRDMKTSYFVGILYCVFMILSVIMLVNMLVALLTKTYDNVTVRYCSILTLSLLKSTFLDIWRSRH